MTVVTLKNSVGRKAIVPELSACNLRTKLSFGDVTFDKAAIKSLKATIFDETTQQVVAGWQDKNILDQGGSTVATDGTLTVRMEAVDNAVVGPTVAIGNTEEHHVVIIATFDDSAVQDREAVVEFSYDIRKRFIPPP